jgi:hypothetical protein
VVLLTTKSIIKDIVHVLMERAPTNINIPAMSQVRRGAGWGCCTLVTASESVCWGRGVASPCRLWPASTQ